MAELNLGTSLSADDYLDLVTAVNRRRNKSNAMLRGLGALTGTTPTMRTSSGFDTSLRAYSKAKDEEILSSIIGYAADHDFLDADGMFDENMFRDWFAEQGLPDKMYEKSAAEFRKRAGRFESVLSATREAKKFKRTESEAEVKSSSEDLARKASESAAGYIDEGISKEEAIKKAISETVPSGGSRLLDVKMVRERVDALRKTPGSATEVYDTRVDQKRLMTQAQIREANKENPGTILPASAAPTEVTDTGAMKALKEKMGIISPVEKIAFKEMNEEQQAQTRENYLTLTQLIKSDQKQNILLQNLTGGPLAKRTYDGIEDIIKIEDPQFFQRTFEVPNAYELFARFKDKTKDMSAAEKKVAEEEFVRKAVNLSGWDPDHIYSLIRPDLYEMGGPKYKRYRIGG